MKPINSLLAMLFVSLLSSPSWSETLSDLVFRDGLYFKKFTDVPFTGKLTGNPQGSFKNGQRDGAWVWYYDDGQLNNKGNYKKGKRDVAWVYYREDGTVSKLMTGAFKGGVKISD